MVKITASKKIAVMRPPMSEHDRIIGAMKKPFWMANHSPLDNTWIINKHGGNVRNGDAIVRFDVVVAPGLRSTDLESDLITAKILAERGLSGNDARYASGSTIPINVRNYFAFVRWRHARGLERNANLTRDDISDLLVDLETKGILGLAPYRQRFDELVQKIESGELAIPFRIKAKRKIAMKMTLANMLGAPHTASLPDSLINDLDEFLRAKGFAVDDQGRRIPGRKARRDRDDEAALSENRLISFMTAPQLLYYYRNHLTHDPIQFEPFPGEDQISQIANSISRVSAERTFTIPAYQGCFLVNQAITWVTTYFEEIQSFTEELKVTVANYVSQDHWYPTDAAFNERLRLDQDRYTSGPGSWWPIHPSYFPSPGWVRNVGAHRPSLRPVLFELLATAALVVIAAFSARRKEEMQSLKEGCISTIDGEMWLETWISKNVREMDKIPVPTTVERAVEVLHWLSKEGRIRTGNAWLLDFSEFVTTEGKSRSGKPAYRFYDGLDRFAEFVGVPPVDGRRWIPKPSEYRRFFGMTYFHRFDFPNLVALSDFYRHFNPTRTRGYITEIAHGTHVRQREENSERAARKDRRISKLAAGRLSDFEECGLEYRISVVRDAIIGDGYMAGFGGTTIVQDAKKQIRDYKAQINLGPDDDLDLPTLNDVLRSMVEPLSIEPHPNGHSACKCTAKAQDLGTASCLRLRAQAYQDSVAPTGPDIEFASELVCAGCVHNVQLPCHRRWWDKALEHEEHEREHALLPFLREIAGHRAAVIEAIVNRCHAQS